MGNKLVKIITQKEFELLYKHKPKRTSKYLPSYRLAMLLGFEAGMRISEIVGYKGKSRKKDKVTGEIIVTDVEIKALTREKIDFDRKSIFIESGKGGKDRIVPLPKRFRESHLRLLPITIPRRSVQYHVTTLGKNLLNKVIGCHTLRAGFVTHLLNNGVPIHQAQLLAGHSRGDTTLIYARADPKESLERARQVF